MGAIKMSLYGFRGSQQYMSKVICTDLGLLRSRMVETLRNTAKLGLSLRLTSVFIAFHPNGIPALSDWKSAE